MSLVAALRAKGRGEAVDPMDIENVTAEYLEEQD
jgi:hypothetical protein